MQNNKTNNQSNNPEKALCKQKPALYIIATPIGNIEDITLRAINTLKSADIIACEDTRVTSKLLKKLNITNKLTCYNDHSSKKERNKIISLLQSGKSVALVSDAGTPLISDPGYKLVKEALEQNISVTSLPGASSVAVALTLSGLPTDRFLFEGFLPPKSGSRKNLLSELKHIKTTLVFFESPKRLTSSLKDIDEVLNNREVAVLREITKKFEEVKRGHAIDIAKYYTNTPPKGEIVIIVGPPCKDTFSVEDIDKKLRQALSHMSLKDAVEYVSEDTGSSKKEIYKQALKLKS